VSPVDAVQGLLLPFSHGRGNPEYVAVTTPAAGATASYTVDGRYAIRVLAARLSLTTDANAANRLVTLDYQVRGGITLCQNGSYVLVTANTTAQVFQWDCHRSVAEWQAGTPVFMPCAPLFLYPGSTVKFNVANIQATDAISGLSLWIEQFQTGPRGYPLGVGLDAPPE
jgi:hypothetical protein